MAPAIQTAVVVAIVLVALAYVGRRAWATMAKGKRSDDGSCNDCHK